MMVVFERQGVNSTGFPTVPDRVGNHHRRMRCGGLDYRRNRVGGPLLATVEKDIPPFGFTPFFCYCGGE